MVNSIPFSPTIVFTGSSIIAQWENLAEFFPGVTILNTAISGAQTPDIYARLNELVIAPAPSVVCYYCGSNDINFMVPPPVIVENVVMTYEKIKLSLDKVKFVFVSIIRAPQKLDRWGMVDQVNTLLSALSKQRTGFGYIDVNPIFFTTDGQPRMDFYQDDQLHLTPAAYAAFGEYLAPRILKLIYE